ncbi:CapA family protein [Poseidonocella sp. HB161398]|uniref:CapA family protein n=1 Tax=Poseidonocella sp. HB161398 TaxID=2320855 RepID=UPI001108549E|nr:CapA family protein [Poseidonocella sp. HB161398]
MGAPARQDLSSPPPWVTSRSRATETGAKLLAPFTVAAVGDLICPQPLARSDPRFSHFAGLLRAADISFGNMESSLVDFATFPHAIAGTAAPFAMGEALRGMGLDMLSRANNHTFDCGVLGMVSTDEALDRLGLTHAGTGACLQEARAARFRETPKGRVGLASFYSVADTGHFGPTYARTLATPRDGRMGGMPGVNPLRLTQYNIVSPAHLDALRGIAADTYGERPGAWEEAGGRPPRFRFYDQWYQAGSDPGSIRYEMDPGDRKGILAAISNGKIYSDFLIATIHSHQATRFDPQGAFGKVKGLKEPLEHFAPDFLQAIAREAIDAGADMFIAHGVHALAGVEIYKGRPIFYGMSNFIFQCGLQMGAGYDVLKNWNVKSELEHPDCHVSVLAESLFDGGVLREIRLHPADLGGGRRPLSQMGIPLVPERSLADEILANLQDYSRPYGTEIAISGGIGTIRN